MQQPPKLQFKPGRRNSSTLTLSDSTEAVAEEEKSAIVEENFIDRSTSLVPVCEHEEMLAVA